MSFSESRLPCGGLNHRIKAGKRLMESLKHPGQIHKRYRDSILAKESEKPSAKAFLWLTPPKPDLRRDDISEGSQASARRN
jgi:hypothetical protein